MELFHSTNDENLNMIDPDRVSASVDFGGLFCLPEANGSHGDYTYSCEVDENNILESGVYIPGEKFDRFIKEELKVEISEDEYDILLDLLCEARSVYSLDDEDKELMGRFFSLEDWEFALEVQAMRGQLTRFLGYDAAQMEDEHGISHLVVKPLKMRKV